MKPAEIKRHVENALAEVNANDRYLLEHNLAERCIASRLAMYLQQEFPEYHVDVEYNRYGDIVKTLGLPEGCGKCRDMNGEVRVFPDIVVHRRGRAGPNLVVLELKKTSNKDPHGCDRKRIRAFRQRLGYKFGALIQCETRSGSEHEIKLVKWLGD